MSCFGGRDEQLYLVEFTVERLKLSADKYREDFADIPPLIKLKFIDMPVFVISLRSRNSGSTSEPYDENEGLIFACGKSCLFVRKPRDLVAAMQSTPLRLGIFRPEETYPIAEATIPLDGCLCDQVAMAKNDENHRPDPYELAGSYYLADSGKNPAGSITIHVRLTLFGTYIISDYELLEDTCIFRNKYDGELHVSKVCNEDTDENDGNKCTRKQIYGSTILASIRSETMTSVAEKSIK